MGRFSLVTWLYIGAVVAAAAAVLAPIRTGMQPEGFWIVCGVLALIFLVCDSTPIVLGPGQWAWSPSSAATLAAVVLLGNRGAIGAAIVGACAIISIRRVQIIERLFNGAMYALAGYAAGMTYHRLGGLAFINVGRVQQVKFGGHLTGYSTFHVSIGPFVAAAIVHVLVNHGLVWGMLLADKNSRATVREAPAWGV